MLSYANDGVGGARRAPSHWSCNVVSGLQRSTVLSGHSLCLPRLQVVSCAAVHYSVVLQRMSTWYADHDNTLQAPQ
jgi:hypothetical protein